MATIKYNDQEKEVPDNSPIKKAAEEFGVPFGCESGLCRTCVVNIKNGEENLMPKTQEEQEQMLEDNERLACQCKIKEGVIEIQF